MLLLAAHACATWLRRVMGGRTFKRVLKGFEATSDQE